MLILLLGKNGLLIHVLLVGGIAGVDERLAESRLLEWLQSCVLSWCGGMDELLLKCGGLDRYMFHLKGGLVLPRIH
jgi:hypothetical protein